MIFPKLIHFLERCFTGVPPLDEDPNVMEENDIDYNIDDELNQIIKFTGFQYDSEQDMFYSANNAWQKKYGYCRLYDELAIPFGMIVDSEPIYFEHGGKVWLIEFWKGQYDLTTGCEIGIYTAKEPNTAFYNTGDEGEKLHMSFSLMKNGRKLFKNTDKHWWLTGFKLGEFSEPSELTMRISIAFKDADMRDAFIQGLENAGYSNHKIKRYGNAVGFVFDQPKTEQPIARMKEIESIIQKKNKYMCDKYQELTGGSINMMDKLAILTEQAPELYRILMRMGII